MTGCRCRSYLIAKLLEHALWMGSNFSVEQNFLFINCFLFKKMGCRSRGAFERYCVPHIIAMSLLFINNKVQGKFETVLVLLKNPVGGRHTRMASTKHVLKIILPTAPIVGCYSVVKSSLVQQCAPALRSFIIIVDIVDRNEMWFDGKRNVLEQHEVNCELAYDELNNARGKILALFAHRSQ